MPDFGVSTTCFYTHTEHQEDSPGAQGHLLDIWTDPLAACRGRELLQWPVAPVGRSLPLVVTHALAAHDCLRTGGSSLVATRPRH
jgi:hypothetical protein